MKNIPSQIVTFAASYQIVNIEPVKSEYVKFTIDSVYYGQKYNDTCIADIEVLGY